MKLVNNYNTVSEQVGWHMKATSLVNSPTTVQEIYGAYVTKNVAYLKITGEVDEKLLNNFWPWEVLRHTFLCT